MLLSEKLGCGGTCKETCMGVEYNRKFSVLHSSLKSETRRKNMNLITAFAVGGEILFKYRVSALRLQFGRASEQRAVVAILFTV